MGESALEGFQSDITLPHEAPFELYHNAFSTCSMKVRVCLSELGIRYVSHHIDLIETGSYENVGSAFARINPGKTVPVLVHNGHPIYESDEQISYAASLAEASSPGLVPAGGDQRELMDCWMQRAAVTHDPLNELDKSAGNAIPGLSLVLFAAMIEKIPFREIAVGYLRHFDRRRPLLFSVLKLFGMSVIQWLPLLKTMESSARLAMGEHLDALEAHLSDSDGPWITGLVFTLADVSWLAILERLRQADHLEGQVNSELRPACHAYWQALQRRDAYREAILEQQHPLVEYGTNRIQQAKRAGRLYQAY
ncbi:MAG: glutathione S-transferase family protein [Pseudomonadota bacterium]